MRVFYSVFMKEIITFLRSWGLVAVVLYSFTLDVYIAGSGLVITPRNVTVGYVDEGSSITAQKILAKLHPPEFQKPKRFLSQKALLDAIFDKEIMVGIIFPKDFEKKLANHDHPQIPIYLDSTAASQAYITLIYLQNILLDFSMSQKLFDLKIHKLFNQNSDSKMFISFVEMLSVITMLGIILTAIVFVKEKEDGTWDILLLTPAKSSHIIFAKAFSQVAIMLGGIIIALGFVVLGVFQAPLNGSFWAFMLLSILYLLTLAGIGLFIAAASQTIMQVAQLSMLIAMPLIFLSGAWTPIYSMPPFLQKLSLISPLRYYIEGSESIFFRGTGWEDLWGYFVGVTILGIITFWYGYKKIGKLF